MTARRPPEVEAAANETLERLCRRLGDVQAPYDEIGRSRAEARLDTLRARQPPARGRRRLGSTVVAFLAGAAAAAIVALVVVPRARPHLAARAPSRLQFEPYVVAPLDAASPPSAVPEALERSSAHLDVPRGWLVRATLGEAIAVTVTGPARAWAEHAANDGRVVVHLEEGRLLASLEGGHGSRLAVVSPGAITEVVGTLFAVEVVGRASRVAVAHGRVAVNAAPMGVAAQDQASPREVGGGQSWLTERPQEDGIDPALAEALSEHERTPPPRGAAVELSVTNALPGANVWVGNRRIASAPAWVRVEAQAAVSVSARPRGATASSSEPPPPSESPPPVAPTPEPAELAPRASAPKRRASLSPPATEPTAPSSPPGTVPPSLVPAEVTARSLFREADRARGAGDSALAVRTLRILVTRYPNDRVRGGRTLRARADGTRDRRRDGCAGRPRRRSPIPRWTSPRATCAAGFSPPARPPTRTSAWPTSGASFRSRHTTPTRWRPGRRWPLCAAAVRRRSRRSPSLRAATRCTSRSSACAPRVPSDHDGGRPSPGSISKGSLPSVSASRDPRATSSSTIRGPRARGRARRRRS